MSHFTTVQTQIQDVSALRDACRELGLELLWQATARGYGGKETPGEYVIRLKGPYDIAVNPAGHKTFGLTTDWWGGHVERDVGGNFSRLLQLYAVHKASREARRKGLLVRRQQLDNGTIKLTMGGMGA